MGTQTLPESGLTYNEYGDSGWNASSFTFDWTRLNNTLLKLSALLDVDAAGLGDGDVLEYNSATTKWETRMSPGGGHAVTTTTTTTSTTSTTTTTTT